MRYVAGVDAGGTRTRAIVANDRGEIVGVGVAGQAGYGSDSIEVINHHLEQALRDALAQTDSTNIQLDSIFIGMAGVVTEQNQQSIASLAKDWSFTNGENVEVDHDIRIALAGGLAGEEGIVVIAGTGSSCYGRNRHDEHWQAGGWQYLLDDSGSAYWTALEGMKAVVRAYDGRGESTSLSARFHKKLRLQTIPDIVQRLHVEGVTDLKGPMSKPLIASFAPLVIEEAVAGDTVARKIVKRGADELARMVVAVAKKLSWQTPEINVTWTGGLIGGSKLVLEAFENALEESLPQAILEQPRLEPVQGAVLLALQKSSIGRKDEMAQRISESFQGNTRRDLPMTQVSSLYSPFDLAEVCIKQGKEVERHLSDLKGCFADEEAYIASLADEDQLIYRVSSLTPGDKPGDLHLGLGMLMPGRIGEEYFFTKGHLHESREAAEVYICLSGNGRMLLENEQTGETRLVPMTESCFVYVPGHTAHRTINTGNEPLRYIGVYPANAGHDYSTIAERGFKHRVIATDNGPKLISAEKQA